MPMYMLPNVNTLLILSVQKYLLALEYILSKGCSAIKCFKKLGLHMLNNDVKFFLSTCVTLSS